jgi:ArsR family transcriptional regulator
MKNSTDLKADMLLALAHPNRIRILEYLQKDSQCACEMGPALGIEQSNLSRHLKILVQAGILMSWKDGSRVNFKVANQLIFKILDIVTTMAKKEIEKQLETLEKN